jgi:hypothetical protein
LLRFCYTDYCHGLDNSGDHTTTWRQHRLGHDLDLDAEAFFNNYCYLDTNDQVVATSSSVLATTVNASTTYLYHDYTVVRDRRGRTAQAGGADVPTTLHRLMDTDKVMDDVDAHFYTTTTVMHGEQEVKTKDDGHSSLIGGALQAGLAEVINRELS